MSFLSRLFSPPVPEQKRSRGYSLHFDGPREAAWTPRRYDALAREGYVINVVGHSAVNRIARAASTIDWLVFRDDKQLLSHPLLDLLDQPNPMQSGPDWWFTRISYLYIAGNNYDERSLGSNGRPKELWPLRPDRMTILKGNTGLPAGFSYQVGQKKVIFPSDEITGDSDILHTKLFHPTDDWYGLSPFEAAAYSIDQHNEATRWVQALLQNAARPSGALVTDKETSLSDDEFKRLRQELERLYTGAGNAGRPMLLEGGLDWRPMGFSPLDMEILKTGDMAARNISLAFGVPPLLLNIPGDNTYANYREARLGFYEDTVLPLLRYIGAEFNQWMQRFYPGVEIRPNLDKIEAIADKRSKLWELADNSDDLTLNESRRLKGYDPLPEPLGSTLMVEIRKSRGMNGGGAEDAAATAAEVAFGASR